MAGPIAVDGGRQRTALGSLYGTMLNARAADRREALLVRQGVGRFSVSGAGHEAMAALATAMRPDDYLFPHYRDRALLLARGVTLEELALEFLAREPSSSVGRNMPSHTSCRRLNVFSIASPVGSGCLPAVGVAWRLKRLGAGGLVLCAVGDGSTRQGEFLEAVCAARCDRLPVVFVVEANQYAISTPTAGTTPLDLGLLPADWCELVDGTDAEAVLAAGQTAAERARAGDSTVLWCRLERLDPHSTADDHRQYRTADELAAAQARDPLARTAELLRAAGWTDADLESARTAAEARVKLVYEAAAAAPVPQRRTAAAGVLGPVPNPPALPDPPELNSLGEAVSWVLGAALERIPETLIYGEDIADPRGGVFGLTRGLSTRHPGRVVNSPLAEATIMGTGVGLAAAGARPVVELQFIDFIGPALNQLTAQVATLRYRSAGSWTCPLVIYAPCGGYVSGGLWHSQTNEGWWTHLPGLRVVCPAYPEDAVGLFWTALAADDPTLILLPKQRLRLRRPSEPVEPVPFGRARIRRDGKDLTVVAWGNGVQWAEQAAEAMVGDGASLEILDLRSLMPWDRAAVRDSLSRTGRLLVVDEDSHTSSFGLSVIAEMTSRDELLGLHLAAPRRVGRPDVPVPFAETLEDAVLPGAEEIVRAARAMLE